MILITGPCIILILIYIAATCRWGNEYFHDKNCLIRWMKSSGYYFYQYVICRIYHSENPDELKEYKRLQQIYVKKDIFEEWREYQAGRYGLILTGVLMLFVVSSAALLSGEHAENISYVLTRPEYGDSAAQYSFNAKLEDGDQESIHLTLDAQVYSAEEIQQRFEDYYLVLKDKVKGSNSSLQEIRTDLDFSEEPEWKAIDVTWSSSDYDYITEEGQVLLEKAPEGTTGLSLYLNMSYEQYSRMFEIPVTIVKYPSDSSGSLQSYLVNAQENSLEEKTFLLPDVFDGKKVQYTRKTDYSVAAGLILLIITVFFLLLYRQYAVIKDQCVKRERQMKADYPEIISKLLILIRAGMPVRSAWIRIVEDYYIQKKKTGQTRYAFEEMGAAVKEMNTGISEGQAYLLFGKRCEQHLYLKLGSLLEQNLKKGSYGIADLLESERIQALEERRRQVRAEGELAGTKLMMPMMMLFALVLMIIMVPALMSFGI